MQIDDRCSDEIREFYRDVDVIAKIRLDDLKIVMKVSNEEK